MGMECSKNLHVLVTQNEKNDHFIHFTDIWKFDPFLATLGVKRVKKCPFAQTFQLIDALAANVWYLVTYFDHLRCIKFIKFGPARSPPVLYLHTRMFGNQLWCFLRETKLPLLINLETNLNIMTYICFQIFSNISMWREHWEWVSAYLWLLRVVEQVFA